MTTAKLTAWSVRERMLSNGLVTFPQLATLLSEAGSAVQGHNNNHLIGFFCYFASAAFNCRRAAIPDLYSVLSNQQAIAKLHSGFGPMLASIGLELSVTTEDPYGRRDEDDCETEGDPARRSEGSEARIEITDPSRFFAVLPQLIDLAPSTHYLTATLRRIAENLRWQLSCNERPNTTKLLREKLKPCGYELLVQFQRLAVPKEVLTAIAQHLS